MEKCTTASQTLEGDVNTIKAKGVKSLRKIAFPLTLSNRRLHFTANILQSLAKQFLKTICEIHTSDMSETESRYEHLHVRVCNY